MTTSEVAILVAEKKNSADIWPGLASMSFMTASQASESAGDGPDGVAGAGGACAVGAIMRGGCGRVSGIGGMGGKGGGSPARTGEPTNVKRPSNAVAAAVRVRVVLACIVNRHFRPKKRLPAGKKIGEDFLTRARAY